MTTTIEGTGRLRFAGDDQGPCEYRLFVREINGIKGAKGVMSATGDALHRAFDAGSGVTIVRGDTGFEMTVFITQLGTGIADITLSGPPE